MTQAHVREHVFFALKGIIHEKVLLSSGWLIPSSEAFSDQGEQEDQSRVRLWACQY